MLGLIKRHMTIYLSNKVAVFFSLLGGLISLGLYLLFLQRNLSEGMAQSGTTVHLYHLWMMGGVLATAAITTSLTGMGQLVHDRERQVVKDFLLADVGPGQIYLTYYVSSSLISLIMQLVMLVAMWGVFYWQDALTLTWEQVLPLLPCLVLVSLVISLLNLAGLFILTKTSSLTGLTSLVGTLAGFLATAYFPMGTLPETAQTVMKLTPALYAASLYRRVLLVDALADFPKDLQTYLGVGVELGGNLTSIFNEVALLLGFGLLGLVVFGMLQRYYRMED